MACGRMLNPRAQYKTGQWAERASACNLHGLPSAQLNEDRLGRTLERIAARAFTIQSQLVLLLARHGIARSAREE